MKLTDRFRPKADYGLLRSLNDRAWKAESERLMASEVQIGEALAQQLEGLYPASDMDVLSKYGCTRNVSEITVRVRLPGQDTWSEYVRLQLGREVRVPDTYSGTYCGGNWYSRDPFRGVKPHVIEQIKNGQHDYIKDWQSFCAEQDARERERVPEQIEQRYYDIIATRKRYSAEYQQALGLSKREGKYPSWAEIAEMFPTLGGVIRNEAAA